MAYNPNRTPKGASNQAGFGTPGTAQTKQRQQYNPNMPMGRQLARQAAGGGAGPKPSRPRPQQPGATWQGADVGGQAYMPSTGQQIQFADPWQTMQMKGVPIWFEGDYIQPIQPPALDAGGAYGGSGRRDAWSSISAARRPSASSGPSWGCCRRAGSRKPSGDRICNAIRYAP